MEGTPAEEAGLKENDIIIKVNDIDVRDKNLTDTVKASREQEKKYK